MKMEPQMNTDGHGLNSFLDKLLDGAEVEWKPVSEVFHLKNGYTPSKSKKEYWEDGTVPWFRMDDIRENGQILDDSLQKVSAGAVKGGIKAGWRQGGPGGYCGNKRGA